MTTYESDFEEHVRQLLSHLYDYLKLVQNPVARRLAAGASGRERNKAIRLALMDAIEELRRENTSNPTSRPNRLYNILLLRYIEEQGTSEVLNQLALSERQYYREHQRAIQTISQVIWDQHFAEASIPASHTLAEELDYLSLERGGQSFDAQAEIQAALRSMRIIAEQRSINIRLSRAEQPVSLNVSQPVFRQLVIYLLNHCMSAMPAGSRIRLSLTAAPALSLHCGVDMRGLHETLQADGTASALLRSLNARLDYVAEPPGISLRFARRERKILIVDDNPDTIDLFQRFLADLPLELLPAQEESEALRIAQATPLLCVILDVMLPGKDGWQILQRFKTNPATAQLPVLICSVLEMQELALSLGADGYLKKPPSQAELLASLKAWI